MKKILSFVMVAVLAVMLGGCQKYDDSELKSRVSALESLNTYQTLLQKLQAGKTVTAYSQSGNDITLTFSDGSSVTFNQQGVPGASIAGPAGPTPTFQIKDDRWQVSYDDGKTWSDVGPAIEKSLFKNVTADGNTLTITLADGTTIPVFYGEKAGYSLKIGNGVRKVYTLYEFEDTFNQGFVKLPYTLSGELNSIDDVKLVLNVTPTGYAYISPTQLVSVEPVDAHSGYLVVNHTRSNSYFNGEGYEVEFPGFVLDFLAIFPDGTTDAQQIEFLTESLQVVNDSGDAFEWSGGGLWANVGYAAGQLIADVDYFIGPGFERYDGREIADIPFNILLNHSFNSNNGVIAIPNLYPDRYTYDYTKDAYLMLEYKIAINYPDNYTFDEKTYWGCRLNEVFGNYTIPLTSINFRQSHP